MLHILDSNFQLADQRSMMGSWVNTGFDQDKVRHQTNYSKHSFFSKPSTHQKKVRQIIWKLFFQLRHSKVQLRHTTGSLDRSSSAMNAAPRIRAFSTASHAPSGASGSQLQSFESLDVGGSSPLFAAFQSCKAGVDEELDPTILIVVIFEYFDWP